MDYNVEYYDKHVFKKIKLDVGENAYASIVDNCDDDKKIVSITTNVGNNMTKINPDSYIKIGNKSYEVLCEHRNKDIYSRLDALEAKFNMENGKLNGEIGKLNGEIGKLNERIVILEDQSEYLSRRTIVVTCAEFLKWIIGMEFKYEESTLLHNEEYREKMTTLLDEVRDMKSLKKRGVAKKTLLYEKGGNLITRRNAYYAHFTDKTSLSNELDYVYKIFQQHTKFQNEFEFEYDLVCRRKKLLKLIA
ncbi:MAG: hypothetical protein ACRCZI_03905 [Cetobacterium sp.]